MANKSETVILRGKTSFAKILGDPRLNYSKDGKEWSMDLVLDKAGVKDVNARGIKQKIKQKDNYVDGQPYIRFKRDEFKKDGRANDPIEVVDIIGKPWDEKKLIGNGSVVDVKFRVVDYGAGKQKGMYIDKVKVLDLVPYDGGDFEPISEEDEYFAKYKEAQEASNANKDEEMREFRKDFGLDDDLDDIGEDEDEPVE